MPFDAGDREYPYFDDEIQGAVIGHAGENGGFQIGITPMLYNDRIVVTHRSEYPYTCSAGFCYDKGGAAALAAMLWIRHWDEMDVPLGFKKEAFNSLHQYGKGSK